MVKKINDLHTLHLHRTSSAIINLLFTQIKMVYVIWSLISDVVSTSMACFQTLDAFYMRMRWALMFFSITSHLFE